jgi:hypothetical protein
MRHLFGIFLAVVAAAAIFFGGGWAIFRLTAFSGHLFVLHASRGSVAAFAALAGTGLLLGILVAVRRISPLAAGLPGIVLLAWSALVAFDTSRGIQMVPLRSHAYGQGFADLLGYGMLALTGAVLIIPLFIPSRWSRWARDDDFADIPSGIGLMR